MLQKTRKIEKEENRRTLYSEDKENTEEYSEVGRDTRKMKRKDLEAHYIIEVDNSIENKKHEMFKKEQREEKNKNPKRF